MKPKKEKIIIILRRGEKKTRMIIESRNKQCGIF
jgi:hypothetical protein